jgi:hypothetical protein
VQSLIKAIDQTLPGNDVRPQRRDIKLRLQQIFAHTDII